MENYRERLYAVKSENRQRWSMNREQMKVTQLEIAALAVNLSGAIFHFRLSVRQPVVLVALGHNCFRHSSFPMDDLGWIDSPICTILA